MSKLSKQFGVVLDKPPTPSVDKLLEAGVHAYFAGQIWDAIRVFQEAIRRDPNSFDAHNNLGIVLRSQGNNDFAIASFRRALEVNPNLAAAHANLGAALVTRGEMETALKHLQSAVRISPSFEQPRLDMIQPLGEFGRFDEALQVFEHVRQLNPEVASREAGKVLSGLAASYLRFGRGQEAFSLMKRAVSEWMRGSEDKIATRAMCELGLCAQHEARLSEALGWFKAALQADPNCIQARSNLFWCMQYSEEHSAEEYYREVVDWASCHFSPDLARKRGGLASHERIRVGYLSPELRDHPIAYCMTTLLKSHDRSRFELYLYSNAGRPDHVSKELSGLADHWRDVVRLSDDEAADLIERDEIDILVDLAGHTENNRIGILARKPAPIQAEWLGYYATTGLSQIDYFLCNPALIPPSEERFYVERPMRLAGKAFSFEPPTLDIPVPKLPCLKNGYVTFGCHNYLAKMNGEVVRVWSEVLKATPGSRLIMNRQAFQHPITRQRFEQYFAEFGIPGSRLSLISTSSREEYLKSLGDLDIFLDTFPFNGGTSTYEAIWMGLPVVTMVAPRMVGHFGESILTALGHEEWVARTPEEYVAAATRLASDRVRLSEIRRGLRASFVSSPLCDGVAFTKEIEAAFIEMRRLAAPQAG